MGAAVAEIPAAAAEGLARDHYENFTVVSWLLPRGLRPHFHALYAYCRTVDDLGDEAPPAERPALLDAFERDLDRAFRGTPAHPVMRALQATLREHSLPEEPLRRLIRANRRDQTTTRYATYTDLLDYCDDSATPVGRLVLALLGHRDAERVRLSDATCTGLQLANFWQDVGGDWGRGRVYIPLEDLARFGYGAEEIARGIVDDRWRALLRFEVARARALFVEGLPLRDLVQGRARLDIALFSRGGLAILDAIEAVGYDVFRRRPTLSRGRKARIALGSLAGLLFRDPLGFLAGKAIQP
ncbi:MAG: squalene synthase HpnC [Planctomycetales bacterium]|nr:squalene synthase HpnC [Planctomycetales bacterium]